MNRRLSRWFTIAAVTTWIGVIGLLGRWIVVDDMSHQHNRFFVAVAVSKDGDVAALRRIDEFVSECARATNRFGDRVSFHRVLETFYPITKGLAYFEVETNLRFCMPWSCHAHNMCTNERQARPTKGKRLASQAPLPRMTEA